MLLFICCNIYDCMKYVKQSAPAYILVAWENNIYYIFVVWESPHICRSCISFVITFQGCVIFYAYSSYAVKTVADMSTEDCTKVENITFVYSFEGKSSRTKNRITRGFVILKCKVLQYRWPSVQIILTILLYLLIICIDHPHAPPASCVPLLLMIIYLADPSSPTLVCLLSD